MVQGIYSVSHPSWHNLLKDSMQCMDSQYLQQLQHTSAWLPGITQLFAAFSVPQDSVNYILLGESPYPRAQSANGYAFWDNAVNEIWSNTGLSKAVNRATSLRNFIKMLLHAKGDLVDDFNQTAISKINKNHYIQTGHELFSALLGHGFLLLNISLVYEKNLVNYHARHWQPFMTYLLLQLSKQQTIKKCITLGKLAQQVPESMLFSRLVAEHPYNISFITNQDVISFFQPFNLLEQREIFHNN